MTTEDTYTYSYKWAVPYDKLLITDEGHVVSSQPFMTNHDGVYLRWECVLRPPGSDRRKEIKPWLGMYLNLLEGIPDTIPVQVGPVLYSIDNQLPDKAKSCCPDCAYYNMKDSKGVPRKYGFPKLIKSTAKHGLYELPFTCKLVTFFFTFRIAKSCFQPVNLLPKLAPVCPVLQTLFETTQQDPRVPSVDMTLVGSDGLKFNVHRCIICACSEGIRQFIDAAQPANDQNEYNIPEIEFGSLKELVHFAYLGTPTEDVKTHLVTTMAAVDKYAIAGFKEQAERVLMEKLRVYRETNDKSHQEEESVIDHYIIAKTHDMRNLEQMTTAIILEQMIEMGEVPDPKIQPYITEIAGKLLELARAHLQVPNLHRFANDNK